MSCLLIFASLVLQNKTLLNAYLIGLCPAKTEGEEVYGCTLGILKALVRILPFSKQKYGYAGLWMLGIWGNCNACSSARLRSTIEEEECASVAGSQMLGINTVLSCKFRGTRVVPKIGKMAWIGSGLTWLERTRACQKFWTGSQC